MSNAWKNYKSSPLEVRRLTQLGLKDVQVFRDFGKTVEGKYVVMVTALNTAEPEGYPKFLSGRVVLDGDKIPVVRSQDMHWYGWMLEYEQVVVLVEFLNRFYERKSVFEIPLSPSYLKPICRDDKTYTRGN